MKPLYRKIHNHFKLNGISFDHDELKEVAYNLIKEGEAFEKEVGDFLLDWLDDCPTVQVHTSGSTGKPKAIRLQKQHMVNSALATGDFFGLRPGDSALLCLPATYIAGKMMLVRAIVLGLELDCAPPSSSPLDSVSKSYDFAAMVPLQLENSLDGLDQVKTLIVGGAPISNKLKKQIQVSSLSTAVFETYGMTETITHIALKRFVFSLGGVADQNRGTVESEAHKPYFKTLPNVTLSTDNRNCLVIEAPKISDVPIVTNDVVDLVSETEFQWLGRYDNVINSGGVKLFPEQIEAKLVSVIEGRFFVAGLPDETLGQKLVLVIEGKGGKEKVFRKIRLLEPFDRHGVPKDIHFISGFVETKSGKVRRKKTLERLFSVN